MVLKNLLRSSAVIDALAWAAARYVVVVARTTRWRVEGADQLTAFAAGPPCIVVFWHESLPSMPVFWLRAQSAGLRREAVVLASRHRDGRLIGQAVANLGIGLVAGSSSRGAAAGLRGLVRALAAGRHVGLTPDGPRGPRRAAAAGAAQLAALSGAKILPCGAYLRWGLRLNSWDRMRLPLPFGRGALVLGAALTIPRAGADPTLVTAALNEAIGLAEQLA
jgi:lysophospholipid acyltransferase (LPLAT)-like uncharacterized protein